MKTQTPEIRLPEPIAAYWKSVNSGDVDVATACFAADVSVVDENQKHQGLPAVRAWIEETTRKYSAVVEPLRLEEREGLQYVAANVSGNFPGSPIELDFAFTLRDGKIARLEIG